jgi:tetratricopeptide (TPR) repeat protein
MQHTSRWPAVLFLLVVARTAPVFSQPAAVDPGESILELAIRSPHERAGDYDALAAAWLEALPGAAESFQAEVIPPRLESILPYLRDPRALIPHVEKAASANHALGSVRRRLLGILAGLHRSAGREEDRARIVAGRGFLREWLVIGPFGKGTGSPFTASFPPEEEERLDRTYEDVWQQLSWRKAFLGAGETTVHPWRHAYPRSGVVYFLSQVECREERDALLLRSSGDSLQVWLDGKLAADDDAGAAFLETERATPVRLRAGWNRILVKTRGQFSVEITDPAGHPFPAGTWSEEDDILIHPSAPPATAPEPGEPPPGAVERWTGWIEDLEERREDGGDEAARLLADARMGLALVHQARGRSELAVAEAEKALALRPGDPALVHHAGVVIGSARYLPRSISKSRSKAMSEQVIAADPEFLPAFEESARHLEEDEQHARAAARMREGLAKRPGGPHDPTPGFLRGLLRLRSIHGRKGWKAEEIEAVREIEKVAPASPVPARFWADHYASLGNVPESTRHLRRAFDLDRSAIELLHEVHRNALLEGKAEDAEAALREAARLAPGDPRHGEALVDLLAARDRGDEALEMARGLAARNPADPGWTRRIAEILDRLGRSPDSTDEYRKALALDPGDIELKRYLTYRNSPAAGGAAKVDAFWAPYDAKLEEWTAAIPEKGPLVEKAASILVLDIMVLRVEVDGSHSEYTHQAYKLLSEESKEELATVQTPGEVVTLRTLTPEGESLEPVPGQGKRSYVMPGLAPGAIVEFAYRSQVRRPGRGFRVPHFFFQDRGFRQSMLLSRYVILLPRGFEPGFIETGLGSPTILPGSPAPGGGKSGGPELARVEKTVRELEDGTTAVIYEARNVPRLEREGMIPATEDLLPNVALVEKQSWADVAGILRSRVSGTTRPTPELAEAAAKATAGIDDPLGRAQAIYRHVNDLVAKGGGGGQAVQVLLEKAGDRTVLFKALCDLGGVTTHWAFLRAKEEVLPRAHWSLPRPDLFPHPFVAVEEEGKPPVFVTLSARGTPFGRLPESIQGGKAMVLLPRGERIEPLPAPHPEESATITRGTLRFGEGHDAEAEVEISSRAVAFYALKDQLKTIPAFQKDLALRRMATQFFPGARVRKAEMRGLDDPDAPTAFVLDLTAPQYLRTSGDDLLLKAVFRPTRLVASFGGRATRELPIHFREERVTRDEIRVEPGESCELERMPRDVLLASALGEYALTYRRSGSAVVVEREMTLRPGRLEAAEYPELLEFSRKVDAAEEESLVFRRRPAKP